MGFLQQKQKVPAAKSYLLKISFHVGLTLYECQAAPHATIIHSAVEPLYVQRPLKKVQLLATRICDCIPLKLSLSLLKSLDLI